MRPLLVLLFALLFNQPTAFAASDAAQAAEIRAQGLKAYAAGDYPRYLQDLRRLSRLRPNHPDVALRLAAAQARTGQRDAALATLGNLADMGVTVDLAADPRNAGDFASLAALPAFAAWQRRIEANASPLIRSEVWHRMNEAGLLTEDVALDEKRGAFFVTSVLRHALLRIDRGGQEQAFELAAPERDWNVLAVAIDGARRRLWVSAQAIRGFPGIRAEDAGKAQLSAYDLDTGKRIHTHAFRPTGRHQAAIADLALSGNGDLLISDSEQGTVLRLAADLRRIEVLAKDMNSPQDLVAAADGRLVFVADYVRGIKRIDLRSGEQRWLTAKPGIALVGIDGMLPWRDGLIAIQNGLRPARVVWLRLDAAQREVESVEVLDRDPDSLGEPTHGVIDGDQLVYLANSGWDRLDEHGAVKPGETLTPAVLRRLKLPQIPPR